MNKVDFMQDLYSSEQKRLLLHPSIEVCRCLWVVPAQKNDPIHGVFGGWPLLPPGISWPTNDKNKYFPYIARLDLNQAQQMAPDLKVSGLCHLFLDERINAQKFILSDLYIPLTEHKVDLKKNMFRSDSVVSRATPFPVINLTFKPGLSLLYNPRKFNSEEIATLESFKNDQAIASIGGLTKNSYAQTRAFLMSEGFHFLAASQKHWMINESEFEILKKNSGSATQNFFKFKFDLDFIYKIHEDIIKFLEVNTDRLKNMAKAENQKWPAKYTSAVNNLKKLRDLGTYFGENRDNSGNNPSPYGETRHCLEELGNFIDVFNHEIKKIHSPECKFIVEWLIASPGYNGFLEKDTVSIPFFKPWIKHSNSRLIPDRDLLQLISENLKFVQDFNILESGSKNFGIQLLAKKFKHLIRVKYCDFVNHPSQRSMLNTDQIKEISNSIDFIKQRGAEKINLQINRFLPIITLYQSENLAFGDEESWMYLQDSDQDFTGTVYGSLTI